MPGSGTGTGTAAAIEAVLRQERGRLVLVAGAAVSTPAPSALPGVVVLKHALTSRLASRAGFGDPEQLAQAVASSDAVKLEAVLQAVSDAAGAGCGEAAAVAAVHPAEPGPLHRWAAAALAQGTLAAIVTTNWDVLFEQAWQDEQPLSRWAAGTSWRAARLLKLHGTADVPGTLRHTFERIDLGLELRPDELPQVLAAPLLVLGWSGSDFDVLAAVPPGGGDVHWLDLPGRTPPGVAELRRRGRTVHLLEGTFDDLRAIVGEHDLGPADGRPQAARAGQVLGSLSVGAARRALDDVLYHGLIAAEGERPDDPHWSQWCGRDALREADRAWLDHLEGTGARPIALGARGARQQYRRRFWRSGATYLQLAFRDRQRLWMHVSSAGDALQRSMWAQPFLRPAFAPVHRRAAAEAAARGEHPREQARMALRWAIALTAAGRRQPALQVLDDALHRHSERMGTYLHAHLQRRKALLLAAAGAPEAEWEALLVDAEARFGFEQRTLELASVQRTRAGCRVLAGHSPAAVREALQASVQQHSSAASVRRSRHLQLCLRLPQRAQRAIVQRV